MLPNKKVVTVKVKRNSSSYDVYRMVASAVGINPQNLDFFSLYEIVEHNFGNNDDAFSSFETQIITQDLFFFSVCFSERKVQPNEYPHSLYIANYSTAAATCLLVKKWLFDRETEKTLYVDPVAREFLFQQVRSSHQSSEGRN